MAPFFKKRVLPSSIQKRKEVLLKRVTEEYLAEFP